MRWRKGRWARRCARWTLTGVMPLLAAGPAAMAQTPPSTTPEVFRKYGERVVKVQVVESSSAAKSTVGSAFFVTPQGHLITNFHVISQLVHAPARYRVEWVDGRGAAHKAQIVTIDVVNDLAVLRTDTTVGSWFDLQPLDLQKGTRLFSLGNPHDLGLSIVEGTYNGLLEHTLYAKIHLTAPINPGMSGGPTVTDAGRVVGVNVSTAGEEVSFLVPAERVRVLLSTALSAGFTTPKDLLGEAGRQISANQEIYLRGMFADSTRTVRLGPFVVPTEPEAFFKCWADADDQKDRPFTVSYHTCSTDDNLFLSAEQSSGIVDLTHQLITTRELSRPRFYAAYQAEFQQSFAFDESSSEEVTSYRCSTRNVRTATVTLRAVICMRRYRKLAGLYDAIVKLATLGPADAGLVTTLTLSGVSAANVERLSKLLLRSIVWRH
ncbi:MAG: serine protease [Gemmatimonadaceae bacterium]